MKPSTEKRSLRQQLTRFNSFGMIAVFTTLIFYIALIFFTVDKYETAFHRYSHISNFYESLDLATGHLKDYLYNRSEDSFQAYEEEINEAKQHITSLRETDFDEAWRIELLDHMLLSYCEQADKTKEVFMDHNIGYEREYSELLDTYELIKKTSDSYYEVLTKGMEQQNEQFLQMKYQVIVASVLFAFLMILWLVYFTRTTTGSITKPLTTILKNISLIKQGTYDLTKISNTNSEMHALCEAMEEMAETIQNDFQNTLEKAALEHRLLETENENLKKDELLAQSEVKMLQNQINPHFLFNTLNMTYKLALAEGAPKCSEMIVRTSALLRYGLDKQSSMSNLKSEINAVENYIAIQEKRLGDRVHFELNVDDEMPNISIPGMILQPLVENALKHGLCNCEADGEIVISLFHEADYVYIQVSDNGDGMDPEVCEQMILHGFHDDKGEHLGLYNVAKRLQMFYQDHVDINIDSAIGCGFSFIIKIKVV